MKRLLRKLHSNSGASMLMALLLLLVAVMVSAVIVAAAWSASLSIRADRAQQQAYLSVSSAAQLLQNEMLTGECNYSVETTTTTTTTQYYTRTSSWSFWDGTTYNYTKYGTPSVDPGMPQEVDTSGNGALSSILFEAIKAVQQNPAAAYTGNYTFAAEEYDDVEAELCLQKTTQDGNDSYQLTICFTGGAEPNQCRIYLTAQGGISESTGQPTTIDSDNYEETNEYTGSGRNRKRLYKKESKTVTVDTKKTEWSNIRLQKEADS